MDISLVTSLRDDEAAGYHDHLAALLGEFRRRLGPPRDESPAPLYLFRTWWEYMDFLRARGIPCGGSVGIFFHDPQTGDHGIATFAEGSCVNEILATLQHEAFHLYAQRLFPHRLPIWLNEGLAQCFEDALMLDGRFRLGHCDSNRRAIIRRACVGFPLHKFLHIDHEGWHGMSVQNDAALGVSYAAAWGVARFFIAADSPWRQRFTETLKALRRGDTPEQALEWLFDGSTCEEIAVTWRNWLGAQTPDPLSSALDRLLTLGMVLAALHKHGQLMPRTVEQFRARMRVLGVELGLRSRSGIYLGRFRGDDPRLFTDPGAADAATFEVIPGATPRTPPTLRAANSPGTPTLSWWSPRPGELSWRVDFADAPIPAPRREAPTIR